MDKLAEMILIIAGAVIMVGNIVTYFVFMFKMRDVISSGRRKDNIYLFIGLFLLIFFLIGYLIVGIALDPLLLTSFILFFGAIFVTVMLIITMRLLTTAKERSVEIAEVLVSIVDGRDPNLNGHSVHVKNLVLLFYKHLPLKYKFNLNQVSLEYAALLHDIGKLGIPESILNKSAKFTPEEKEIMRNHPKLAVKFLKPLHSFDPITDWILYHHERVDGNGYYALKPDLIPIASKIIAVCDTYSAITMRRSYKTPRSYEEAIKIMKDVSGTQLDKELVDIFVSIPKEEVLATIPEAIKN